MSNQSKFATIGLFTVMLCTAIASTAFSVDREVYDKPEVHQPGKTMQGKVIAVNERDASIQRWDVSVQNADTGEVVVLHIDKTTTRKDMQMHPAIGDNVIAKYDVNTKHAVSFLTDARSHN